jgi:N-methylhydantoinase B
MTFIMFGEGRRIPALGAAGAESRLIDPKVGRLEWKKDGKTTTIRDNIMEVIKPGETVTNMNPGGGGFGDPMKRPIEKVVEDIRNGLVSLDGARLDYGVVITDLASLKVDLKATHQLRSAA